MTIDWERRWAHATQHTAQHVASAVCEDWLGAPTLSWHLGETDATVELGSPFTAEHVPKLEESRQCPDTRRCRGGDGVAFGERCEGL